MTIKIQGFGLPFDTLYSSCSRLKPKKFEWSNEKQEIQIYTDAAIVDGISTPYHDKKYAWICESRFIYSANCARELLLADKEKILSSFKYLFTCEKELCKLDDRIKWCYAGSNLPWVFSRGTCLFPKKTKLVSMICSNKTFTQGHLYRLEIANKLKDKLDLFGGAYNSKRIGEDSMGCPDKKEALDEYMFSVVFENDSYSSYFTEKITDCFARGVVPIYYGDPTIAEHFNMDGIIQYYDGCLDDISQKIYLSKLSAIVDNMLKINNIPMAEDYFFQNYIIKELK